MRAYALSLVAITVAASLVVAGAPPPQGLLAVSAGESVVLATPDGVSVDTFRCGPVGWLYPAPGGRLFAPDLIGNRTTVLDLRARRPVARLDGVTTPHFGLAADRYLVVADRLLVVSYPERAPIFEVDVGVESPWQVVLGRDDAVALILDRRPDGEGGATLVAVDLANRRVAYRLPLAGDVVRMALSPRLSLLALADRQGSVALLDPASHQVIASLAVAGEPRDVGFSRRGATLTVAVATAGGEGALRLCQLKAGSKGLRRGKERALPLAGAPVSLAVGPAGRWAAVALEPAELDVVELGDGATLARIDLPGPPRDVVWCDPSRPGPLVPEWSDTPAVRR